MCEIVPKKQEFLRHVVLPVLQLSEARGTVYHSACHSTSLSAFIQAIEKGVNIEPDCDTCLFEDIAKLGKPDEGKCVLHKAACAPDLVIRASLGVKEI